MGSRAGKIWRKANWTKAYYYCRKNGLTNTFFAALERIQPNPYGQDKYEEPAIEVLAKQRSRKWEYQPKFSILVPAYHTREPHLRDMIESVLNQTYSNLELVIADAGEGIGVAEIVKTYDDSRIVYKQLETNDGISANTNAALQFATGEYVGLLDHDDVLTPDALYEMNRVIQAGWKQGAEKWMLYSDEDKCDENRENYEEPHRKKKFNLELLLSNNYICHFLVMKTELIRELQFRKEYDGAQDYDLVLRAAERLLGKPNAIAHIPKVLYHWRCHSQSTAENPRSKQYAYDAGKKAVEDFLHHRNWKGEVHHLQHLGFYRVEYDGGILKQRPDVGAVGGKLLKNHKIIGGLYKKDGTVMYRGLPERFGGYMHRAELRQEAQAVDIRCMQVQESLYPLVAKELGLADEKGLKIGKDGLLEQSQFPKDTDYVNLSIRICSRIRAQGYHIVWDPKQIVKL